MKELRGRAAGVVRAPAEDCVRFLAALGGYASWYPEVVREVEVLERDARGDTAKVRAILHLAWGPVVRDFDLVMAVGVTPPRTITLTRIPNDPSDEERFEVTWRVDGDDATRIVLEIDAYLSMPRLLPVGGVADTLAEGFLEAASRALVPASG